MRSYTSPLVLWSFCARHCAKKSELTDVWLICSSMTSDKEDDRTLLASVTLSMCRGQDANVVGNIRNVGKPCCMIYHSHSRVTIQNTFLINLKRDVKGKRLIGAVMAPPCHEISAFVFLTRPTSGSGASRGSCSTLLAAPFGVMFISLDRCVVLCLAGANDPF